LLQEPQCVVDVEMFVSQPSSGLGLLLSLQLPKPALQVGAQRASSHCVALALSIAQLRPHLPQFAASPLSNAVSQPLLWTESQSPKFDEQRMEHAPAEQVGLECAGSGHGSQEVAAQPKLALDVDTQAPPQSFWVAVQVVVPPVPPPPDAPPVPPVPPEAPVPLVPPVLVPPLPELPPSPPSVPPLEPGW
jgi:hypothetical protein